MSMLKLSRRAAALAGLMALVGAAAAHGQVAQVSPAEPVPVATPKPVADLRPTSLTYKATITGAGQQIEMTQSCGIKGDAGTWIVTETSTTTGLTVTDRTVLEKGSLVVRKRSSWQGPVTIEFEVKDDWAVGTIRMNEKMMPLAVDLGGPLFADGAGAYQVLAALPLSEGYSTRYRTLDLQTQKISVQQLAVAGSEQIIVPAGTFDTFKVELTSPDDQSKATLWISKADRTVVKMIAVSAQPNGATMTSELVK